ncbi:MAG: aminotransferase class I/II-fold pyridoxal phosphate-dependent enzyme, partial [Anaerolineae bacterium]|nr:aminotransferase class I/II-fold pyridoxal phosphate-dependent enzyme [Gemmatimonadaceae bacterium]
MTLATDPEVSFRLVEALRDLWTDRSAAAALHEPFFGGNETAYVRECIDTGWVSSVGKFVDRFEQDLAAFTGARRAVAVANGTAALHVALVLAGVKPGDEVIIPTLTFVG